MLVRVEGHGPQWELSWTRGAWPERAHEVWERTLTQKLTIEVD